MAPQKDDKDEPGSKPRSYSQAYQDYRPSDRLKKFCKDYRTPIASGSASIISTFIAVCMDSQLLQRSVLISSAVSPRLCKKPHAIVSVICSNERQELTIVVVTIQDSFPPSRMPIEWKVFERFGEVSDREQSKREQD